MLTINHCCKNPSMNPKLIKLSCLQSPKLNSAFNLVKTMSPEGLFINFSLAFDPFLLTKHKLKLKFHS